MSTITATNVGTTRRAALGDLANKTKTVNSGLIKVEKGSIDHTKDLKDVKPRVDTRWASNAAALKKPLTRSNSIKTSIPKVMVTSSSEDGPKLVRTRSSSIAVKEVVTFKSKTSISSIKTERNADVKPKLIGQRTSTESAAAKKPIIKVSFNECK